MVPESCQEAGEAEEEALSSLVDREPVSGHLGPPASTPADLVAPAGLKDTKPSSKGVVFPLKLQTARGPGLIKQPGCWHCSLAPESLDPRTLKLLWRQRELEIQALRCAIQEPQSVRRGRILQEVAGLPFERSSHSQKKLLQTQVQKLTLELKEQKEQAQLVRGQGAGRGLALGRGLRRPHPPVGLLEQEKVHLEEQLMQTKQLLQQVEAELQAMEKSCLLQLARSSWIGRMLRSSTGSVEVVTAETLIDPSDLSENDEAPPAQEGFRLEDVDWNSVAHRYPNLFATTKHLEPQPPTKQPVAPAPEERGSEPSVHQAERSLKTVEWRPLPLEGTSSSGGADSDSSSPRLDLKSRMQKVTGHLPWAPGHTSEQTKPQAGSCRRDSQAESEGGWGASPWVLLLAQPAGPSFLPRALKGVPQPLAFSGGAAGQLASHQMSPLGTPRSEADPKRGGRSGLPPRGEAGGPKRLAHRALPRPSRRSPTGSCLKIVAVSRREKSVRIVNESLEETADLGGFALQQLQRDFPVRMYRFPPHTLLAPQHHVTVWGEGPGSTKKQPPSSLGRETVHFQSSRGCVTLLLSPKGEVSADLDGGVGGTPRGLGVSAPLAPVGPQQAPGPALRDPGLEGLRRQHRLVHRPLPALRGPVRGQRPRAAEPAPTPARRPDSGGPGREFRVGPAVSAASPSPPTGPSPTSPGPVPARTALPARALWPTPPPRPARTPALLPRLGTSKPFRPPEVPARPESAETATRELLPAVPGEHVRGRGGRGRPARPPSFSHADHRPGFADCQARKEHRVPVCRKTVDRSCPMVALSVQSTAESRFGFRFLSCPPITVDACRRV
ncbi:LOW QUALITY PROTEIN: lamin tail domain-containing protein 2 [Pteropus alecto]|uniref:LOW QUALITY PROTEIN: lamin tail domain-containing protein 2 n=1 Tax=Pteropus alecto TaxID=9402 RepID=UPI000D539796|nr:LOW QUALITY PROTEIN: lamin tail domain-containing protein 2 [Pteropus alecto]